MMYRCLRRISRILCFLFISLLIIILSRIQFIRNLKCPLCPELTNSTASMILYNGSLNTEDENTIVDDYSILCSELGFHLNSEQYFPQSPIIFAPSFNSQRLYRFPYHYSQWKSSSIFPRAITPCEHTLIMHLLIIIDRICRENKIIYFISDGTLLGSLRHHDIIPWDNDVDIMLSNQQRKLFFQAFKNLNQTLMELKLTSKETNEQNLGKLYFRISPNAGQYPWRFPFIDIFFYSQNETHIWRLKGPGKKVKITHVFPLSMRPLGQIWLPAPRNPRGFFEFNSLVECVTHSWDHRKEIELKQFKISCKDLKDIYPFVERNSQTNSTEVLKLNDTIIHTIIFE